MNGKKDQSAETDREARRNNLEIISTDTNIASINNYINKIRTMSRRRFLQYMASTGVGSAALSELTKEAVARNTDDHSDQVVELFGYQYKDKNPPESGQDVDREPVFFSIPRDQWVRTECANAAAQRLEKQFEKEGYSFGVSSLDDQPCVVAKHINYVGSQNKGTNKSFDQFESDVPYTVDQSITRHGEEYSVENIPVRRRKEKCETQGNYFTSEYRPVPGGCEAGTGADGDAGGGWTIGHPARDSDNLDMVLVTASHCIDRTDDKEVYQPSEDEDDLIGKSDAYTQAGNGDVATIKMADDVDNHYDIATYGGDTADWTVVGTVSRSALDNMAANNDMAYQQGRRTGRDDGPIVDHFDKNADSGPKVRIACDTDGGDSGGPYFMLDEDDDAWRIGIHAWSSSTEDDEPAGSGNTFYYAESELDVE